MNERRVIHREPLAEGDEGVRQTIQYMEQLVHEGARDPMVQALLPPWATNDRATHDYIRHALQGIRFEPDPPGVEAVLHPSRMAWDLAAGVARGDCDCIATLGGALASSVGMPVSFITSASHPAGSWSHVWAQTPWGDLDVSRELQGISSPMLHRVHTWGWMR